MARDSASDWNPRNRKPVVGTQESPALGVNTRQDAKQGDQETAPSKYRILIVDDHPVVRAGVQRMLERQRDLECCGEAGSGQEALRLAEESRPHLVILELLLANGDGIALIKELADRFAETQVLVLSLLQDRVYVEHAVRAGARGYVTKKQDRKELLRAIRTVLGGEVCLPTGMASEILASLVRRPRASAPHYAPLTDRELTVLNLLGIGRSTREIAGILKVSFKTVESHRENIKRKLGLNSATELVHFAVAQVGRTERPRASGEQTSQPRSM